LSRSDQGQFDPIVCVVRIMSKPFEQQFYKCFLIFSTSFSLALSTVSEYPRTREMRRPRQRAGATGQDHPPDLNVPPRSLKSNAASVAFPAWLLGHRQSLGSVLRRGFWQSSFKHSDRANGSQTTCYGNRSHTEMLAHDFRIGLQVLRLSLEHGLSLDQDHHAVCQRGDLRHALVDQ